MLNFKNTNRDLRKGFRNPNNRYTNYFEKYWLPLIKKILVLNEYQLFSYYEYIFMNYISVIYI